MRAPRTPASEFPNDNPELHDGAIWTSSEPCAALEAEFDVSDMLLEPAESEPEPEPVVEVDEPAEMTAPAPPVVAHGAPPADDAEPEVMEDTFTWLLRAMSSCAVEAGTIIDLEDLEMLLCMGRVDAASLPAGAADALVEGGLAVVVEEEVVADAKLVATARTWRRVLAGEDADMDACGGRMLDEWTSDVLARLLGAPQRADALRRDLRRRGIAAFGVLVDAA